MHAFYEVKNRDYVYAQPSQTLNFPLHLHMQMELFWIRSGEMAVTVRDQSRIMRAGELAVIFPNEIHSYMPMAAQVDGVLCWWDLAYTGGYMDMLLQHHPADPFLSGDSLHPNVTYALMTMMEEQKTVEKSSVYAPLIQLILARILPQLQLRRNRSSDFPELTYQIARYIGEHFQENIDLASVARAIGVSRYHLSHLFQEKMGQNFPSYLANIRLSYACKMLMETDVSVTDIAEEVGFESQRTFFRTFRSHLGLTPLKYRKNARQTMAECSP